MSGHLQAVASSRPAQYRADIVYDERTAEIILEALGPVVQKLIADRDVTEIFLRRTWAAVERLSCGFERYDDAIKATHIDTVLHTLAPLLGNDLSLANPAVEITLPIDGQRIRFTGLYCGAAGIDSVLTLRVIRAKRVALKDLCNGDQQIIDVLMHILEDPRRGLLIAGGVGVGKTTTLRSVCDELIATYGKDEHFVVVEDNEELLLEGPQVTSFCSTQWFGYRDLCRHALRQRPTRFIVGEIRGAEAFDAVNGAAAAGAGLGMTIHSPTAAGAVRMLLTRMRQGSENGYVDPTTITDAIHYVLVMARKHDKFTIRELAHLERVDSNGIPTLTGVLQR
jgi:pilus assembly protein CpaF